MKGMKARHEKYGIHRVFQGDDEIAIWSVSDDGHILVPLATDNIILRVGKTPVVATGESEGRDV